MRAVIMTRFMIHVFVMTVVAATAVMTANSTAHAGRGSPQAGRELYLTHCQQCHGPDGKGDGSASVYLMRRPRNFTDGIYKIKTSPPEWLIPRDEDIFGVIGDGMSTSGMPPFKHLLSEEERWNLVAYLKTLSDAFKGEDSPPALDYSAKVPYSQESVERGAIAFVKLKCIECHGPEGTGPSMKQLKDDYGELIWPRDLTRPSSFIGPYTPEGLYSRITNGIPLTPMPSHMKSGDMVVPDQTRWDVVNYITWLKDEAEKRRWNWMMASIATLALALFFARSAILRFFRALGEIGKTGSR